MALFTEQQLRSRTQNQILKANLGGSIYSTPKAKAKFLLENFVNEQRLFSEKNKVFDIFLSHSSDDAELVAGLKLKIEDLGYSVYVDWIEDPELNRASVNKNTALLLKERMNNCKSLIYAFSENASNSKWMPWELGYFDGIKGAVAVLPIAKSNKSDFVGSEHLGIYYYIQIDSIKDSDKMALWIHETETKYTLFTNWLTGTKPLQR